MMIGELISNPPATIYQGCRKGSIYQNLIIHHETHEKHKKEKNRIKEKSDPLFLFLFFFLFVFFVCFVVNSSYTGPRLRTVVARLAMRWLRNFDKTASR